MIDISRPIGQATVQAYYKKKWTLDDYYTQANQLQGFWYGQGAERLGLRGAVHEKDFARIMAGRRPDAAYETTQLQSHSERSGTVYQLRDIDQKVAAEVFAESRGWKHSGDPEKVYQT